uniref:Uncharacterized protein n=2 Tax=Lotharella oceanica TaxID=641309 RepID=A0A7S2TMP6_9EUKA|mmetsp:Transcript_21490/g.40268  ORF Transcript_21490/g.40268 Transcript_21490/m.40268 type:complete len:117 (+) Transcript_21490:145-495(+)
MIHEATYSNDLAKNVAKYGHSTAGMAGRFAQETRSKTLVLTHISSRFNDPRYDEKELNPMTEALLKQAQEGAIEAGRKEDEQKGGVLPTRVLVAHDFLELERTAEDQFVPVEVAES